MVRLVILFLFISFQTFIHSQTTYTLISNNGDWGNPAAWSPNGIPGPGDFVIIGNTVEISGSYEIAGFNLAHGTIKFIGEDNPSLTVTDSSIWSSGTFNGGNGANGGNNVNNSLIFAEGSVVTLVEDTLHRFHLLYEGTYLTNQGTIKLQGTANLAVRGLSILKNEGIFDVMSDADFNGESFSGGTFLNTGTFRKSGGTDITSFNIWWNFVNEGGAIDVQSGTLKFDCNGSFNNGTYNADAGALLSFSSLAQTIKGTLSGSPAGDVRLAGSTISVDSSGATLDFQGSGFQWSRGTFTGGGTLTIPEGSLLRLVTDPTNPQNQALYGGTTLLNLGTIKQESNNSLSIRNLSVVENRSLFDVTTDADFTGGTGSGGTFLNTSTGVFRKSGGTDISSFNTWWNFINESGAIEVQSGTLKFDCNGSFNNGTYNANADALLSFPSHTQTIKGTLSGSPSGDVRLSGSTINVDSSGATLDFQGSGFQWSRGTFSGGGTLTIPEGSLLRLVTDPVNPQNQALSGGTTLLNLGTIKQESNNSLSINNNSVVDNRSLFDVTTDADFTGGSAGTFYNTGTFRKSAGNDVTQMDIRWKFYNQNGGIIDAASGELKFAMSNTNFSNEPGAIIKGAGSIGVPTNFTNNGITAPGNSAGTLSYIGNFLPSATAVLDIQLGGLNQAEYDQLNVTGSAKLNGTLKVSLLNGFIPAVGDSFVVLTTTSAITDSFVTFDVQSGLYLTIKKNANNVTIFVDSVGTISSLENETDVKAVTSYELSQNYPNPFNPTTTIQFALPQAAFVMLEVFNIVGERVDVLVSQELNSGKYNYEWNGLTLTSGVYFYRLRAGSFVETRKMILLK